jgi:hypothetical protein
MPMIARPNVEMLLEQIVWPKMRLQKFLPGGIMEFTHPPGFGHLDRFFFPVSTFG